MRLFVFTKKNSLLFSLLLSTQEAWALANREQNLREAVRKCERTTYLRDSHSKRSSSTIGRKHMARKVLPGSPYQQGAIWDGAGVNFALYSEKAERVQLCLFDSRSGEETECIDV